MGLSRQEYWSGLPFPSPGIFLAQESNLHLLHLQADFFFFLTTESPGKLKHFKMFCWTKTAKKRVCYHLCKKVGGKLMQICFLFLWVLKSPFKDAWENKSRRNLRSWELARGRAGCEEFLLYIPYEYKEVQGAQVVNNPANAGDSGSIPGPGRAPGNLLQCFLPGEFHGQRSLAGLQSLGSQRVRHDWMTKHIWTFTYTKVSYCEIPAFCSIFEWASFTP